MKNPIIVLSALILMCSCEEPAQEIDIAEKVEVVEELSEWELEEIGMQNKVDSLNAAFKERMREKDFVFKDDGCKQGMVGEEDMNKYRGKGAYNILSMSTDTTFIVDFSFIDNCCLDYIGDIDWVDDTLKLKYSLNAFTPCDCSCSYCSSFEIQTKGKSYKTVTLNGKVIE